MNFYNWYGKYYLISKNNTMWLYQYIYVGNNNILQGNSIFLLF